MTALSGPRELVADLLDLTVEAVTAIATTAAAAALSDAPPRATTGPVPIPFADPAPVREARLYPRALGSERREEPAR